MAVTPSPLSPLFLMYEDYLHLDYPHLDYPHLDYVHLGNKVFGLPPNGGSLGLTPIRHGQPPFKRNPTKIQISQRQPHFWFKRNGNHSWTGSPNLPFRCFVFWTLLQFFTTPKISLLSIDADVNLVCIGGHSTT